MTIRYRSFSFLILGLSAAQLPAAEPPVWLRDLDAAKADAQAASKDLFLLFTGVGWCVPCMDFDKKVLRQPAFLDQVQKTYTLVEFDHTFGETPAEKERKARFEKLEKQYLINGFPTVVLADAQAVPYAVMTGYEGEVPETLAWIAKARAARGVRDREFRAGRFHEGIQAVAKLLGTLDERHDDPVLVYYKDQVAEIGRLDPAGAGRVYTDRRAALDRWVADQAVITRLQKFAETNDWRGSIAFIDETLRATTDPVTRLRLERMRGSLLERDDRYDEALRAWRDLLSRPGLNADEQYQLRFREVRCLFHIGRVEEGIALYDRCIAAADTPQTRVHRLEWKAQLIPIKTHHDLKMAAWRACRAEAPRAAVSGKTPLPSSPRTSERPVDRAKLWRYCTKNLPPTRRIGGA